LLYTGRVHVRTVISFRHMVPRL